MDEMKKAYLMFFISIILYWILNSTKGIITYDIFTRTEINIYVLYLFKVMWYLSYLFFLQSSLTIINGRYNEKDQTRLFYLQIITIILGEFASYAQMLNSLF